MSGTHRRWNFRQSLIPIAVAVIAVGAPVVWGTVQVQQFAMSSQLNVFILYMGSPLVLVIPFLAAWAGNARLHAELGHRHVANLRSRLSVVAFLRARLVSSFLLPCVIFGASVLVVYAIAFLIWPLLGDPFIDPSINLLSSGQDVADYEQSLTAFTQLMAFGSPVFGAVSALWFGFAAGIYGAFAAAALVLLQNRMLAMLLPLGMYMIQTIAAAILVGPYAGLLYSLAPFGLQQAPIPTTAAPTVLLALGVAAVWVWIFRHPRDLLSLR
ncbi:hypothetical protein [Homoserinimonas hongtaonis]|uniref:hypothetical protein n=1 Tax=Homoserinimonas hongtaonis TaxID=2079791 RepID=UPI00131EF9FD|nr:hypothetical protein [Salinibacterium hongtaonis]